MSKSAGNVVSPQEVMKQYGADILRLWVASCDYSQDVRLSNEILERMADAYRKIRNTFRYLLANLHDFDPAKDALELERLEPIDQYIWAQSREIFRKIYNGYQKFIFNESFSYAYILCNVDLSSYYLDIVKDRLYTSKKDSLERRSSQTAMFWIARDLAKLLAPILSFTTDEVWRSFRFEPGTESVHEALWPAWLVDKGLGAESKLTAWEVSILGDWESVRAAHKAILSKLEEKRVSGEIAASLDAKVLLRVKKETDFQLFKKYEQKLRFYFILSQFSMEFAPNQTEPFEAEVGRADGAKCVRCWNYSTQVGHFKEHLELCERCVEVV